MRFALLIFLALLRAESFAATYFVDFAAGSDANNGTSTNTPWRTIPGTRTTAGTAYLRTAWGSITSTSAGARIQNHSRIEIKRGTAHNAANGGYVLMSKDSSGFYLGGCDDITIGSSTSWGTGGDATIDGAGMTAGIALVVVQIDGVSLLHLNINNGPVGGVMAKEKPDLSAVTNFFCGYVSLSNNGTSLSLASGEGKAQLQISRGQTYAITNCTLLGNGNFLNGFFAGDEDYEAHNGLVADCISDNHAGNDDGGIGFKVVNGTAIFRRNTATRNFKGWDLGEIDGIWDVDYLLVDNTAAFNTWGINFNGRGGNYSWLNNFVAVNNLVLSNTAFGMDIYAEPWVASVVHNIFDGNGTIGSNETHAQLGVTVDGSGTNGAYAYVYNNIFTNGGGAETILVERFFTNSTRLFLDFDYNCYRKGATENFCLWSYNVSPQITFTYGQGPGGVGKTWYDWFADGLHQPPLSTGHYHCDANSVITAPPFSDVGDYTLTNSFRGSVLSTQSWYRVEMGFDRNGVARQSWDIGMYEFRAPAPVNEPLAFDEFQGFRIEWGY